MKLLALALSLSLAAASIAHAEEDAAPAAASTEAPMMRLHGPDFRVRRRVAIGLLASSALFLTLGFVFVGLAKNANDSIYAGATYHPEEANRRLDFEATDVVMFTLAGATAVPGLVLMWDR